ncbi:hypothetical protein ES703_71479 [subsurface metagenome]
MAANNQLFKKFQKTEDTLWICLTGNLLFRSTEKGIAPLLTYLQEFPPGPEGVIVFDRVVGNAAALLLKKAFGKKVYSLTGSELAAKTLKRLGITYSFLTVVPYISNRAGDDMCPFEKASIGKSPEEFYEFAKEKLALKEKQ